MHKYCLSQQNIIENIKQLSFDKSIMSKFNALPTDMVMKIRGFLPFFHDFDAVSRDFLAATREYQLQNVVDSVSHLSKYQLARLVVMCAAHITAHWTAIRDKYDLYIRWKGHLQTRSVSEHISDSCELIDELIYKIYGDINLNDRNPDDIDWKYIINRVTKFSSDIFPNAILILDNLKICDRNLTTDLIDDDGGMQDKIYRASSHDFDNSFDFDKTGAPECTFEYNYWLDPTVESPDEESQIVIDAFHSSSVLSYGMLLRAHQRYPIYRKLKNQLERLSIEELASRLESICRSNYSEQTMGIVPVTKHFLTKDYLIYENLCSQLVHV
jgi:hypothetical protein